MDWYERLRQGLGRTLQRFTAAPHVTKPLCYDMDDKLDWDGQPLTRQRRLERNELMRQAGEDEEDASSSDHSDDSMFAEEDRFRSVLFRTALKDHERPSDVSTQRDRVWRIRSISKEFPGWDEFTIYSMDTVFDFYCDPQTHTIDLKDFCTILEVLGEESSAERRRAAFQQADSDGDGRLSFAEALRLVYSYDEQPAGGPLTGTARLAQERFETTRLVSGLPLDHQLVCGLF